MPLASASDIAPTSASSRSAWIVVACRRSSMPDATRAILRVCSTRALVFISPRSSARTERPSDGISPCCFNKLNAMVAAESGFLSSWAMNAKCSLARRKSSASRWCVYSVTAYGDAADNRIGEDSKLPKGDLRPGFSRRRDNRVAERSILANNGIQTETEAKPLLPVPGRSVAGFRRRPLRRKTSVFAQCGNDLVNEGREVIDELDRTHCLGSDASLDVRLPPAHHLVSICPEYFMKFHGKFREASHGAALRAKGRKGSPTRVAHAWHCATRPNARKSLKKSELAVDARHVLLRVLVW